MSSHLKNINTEKYVFPLFQAKYKDLYESLTFGSLEIRYAIDFCLRNVLIYSLT